MIQLAAFYKMRSFLTLLIDTIIEVRLDENNFVGIANAMRINKLIHNEERGFETAMKWGVINFKKVKQARDYGHLHIDIIRDLVLRLGARKKQNSQRTAKRRRQTCTEQGKKQKRGGKGRKRKREYEGELEGDFRYE